MAVAMAQLLQIYASSLLRSRKPHGYTEKTALIHEHKPDSIKISHIASTSVDVEVSRPTNTAKLDTATHPAHDHGPSHCDDHSDHGHALLFDERIEKHVSTYILELGIAAHRWVLLSC